MIQNEYLTFDIDFYKLYHVQILKMKNEFCTQKENKRHMASIMPYWANKRNNSLIN